MNVDGGYRVDGMEMAVTAHANKGFMSDETDAALVASSGELKNALAYVKNETCSEFCCSSSLHRKMMPIKWCIHKEAELIRRSGPEK